MQDTIFAGAEIISEYTAARAVDDGVLVDGNQVSAVKESFRGAPVYFSQALWALIEKAVAHPRWCNDLEGVCWDICWMSRGAVAAAERKAKRFGCGRATFLVIITGCGRKRNHRLDANIDGNGLTFLLEGED